MIRIQKLSKTFDRTPVLTDLNMTIQTGSIYGLIGVNGAGKTTLIKNMSGMLRGDGGSITYDGESIWENDMLKQSIGLIPDDLYFPNGYSLRDMRSVYSGFYENWNDDRFHQLTELFKLDEKAKIRTFSKGMKKQAAFCLVMATMPAYLLLDEPIDGLDPIVRKLVWKTIVNDVADRQMSVLVSSHNLKEMEGICDYIGILSHGRMLMERELDSVKHDLHKIQISYGKNTPEQDPFAGFNVLRRESRGTVELMVVKGSIDRIEKTIRATDPVIFDILPLSLEEIFIYELGGEDDEISKLIF
ncbi:ABC transporter ATP-binding protein [Aminicella lysinilytica]|mgnify:CR=1 FL=1|uniref:ABC transporter ATP-binding protein n=1 Tax=Aminicella lysinilytica TaxID=433323 RepID=UPI0026ED6830|nr:ABC transporter ATP-binding protein [Aminicella lysinilytica]